jgi:hypothetical protein
MRTVEFRRLFDDKNAARVRFELKRNRVLRFVVQLECRFNDEWHPVVRYDTAHNFAHRDVLLLLAKPKRPNWPSRTITKLLRSPSTIWRTTGRTTDGDTSNG